MIRSDASGWRRRPGTMHELFKQVLNERDLSRAGDLFSIPDSEINDLTEVVSLIPSKLFSLNFLLESCKLSGYDDNLDYFRLQKLSHTTVLASFIS